MRAALKHLRQGASELLLDELGTIRSLRIGIIDDFDSEVSPQLAVAVVLADSFKPGERALTTATSTRIMRDVVKHEMDMGIAASPMEPPDDVAEIPLLHDAFVLAVPRGYLSETPPNLESMQSLSFLRYEKAWRWAGRLPLTSPGCASNFRAIERRLEYCS